MCGPFVHNIDPIITSLGNVHLWWYGASYTFGFLVTLFWLNAERLALGYSKREVYASVIFLAVGVLIGGRFVEVLFYEWSHYGTHPLHIPAIWLGGMSTHGILLGAVIGSVAFCRNFGRRFWPLADRLVIAGALIMGLGRMGNFIDGQIAGGITDVCWGVKFPDLASFRHPVVLYDGAKNLLLIPLLLYIRTRRPPPGVLFGHFLFWYGFLRIFIDFFREYRVEFGGLPPGQGFNIIMSLLGIAIVVAAYRIRPAHGDTEEKVTRRYPTQSASIAQRIMLLALLVLPLIIPSDWTQDVPSRYGDRHPGLEYSVLYPRIADDSTQD